MHGKFVMDITVSTEGHISNMHCTLTESDITRHLQIESSVRDALGFLEARRDFWHQQKPVYARENEAMMKLKQKKLY